jgi:hypothetical protein
MPRFQIRPISSPSLEARAGLVSVLAGLQRTISISPRLVRQGLSGHAKSVIAFSWRQRDQRREPLCLGGQRTESVLPGLDNSAAADRPRVNVHVGRSPCLMSAVVAPPSTAPLTTRPVEWRPAITGRGRYMPRGSTDRGNGSAAAPASGSHQRTKPSTG